MVTLRVLSHLILMKIWIDNTPFLWVGRQSSRGFQLFVVRFRGKDFHGTSPHIRVVRFILNTQEFAV